MGFRFKRFDYASGVEPMVGEPFADNPTDAMARGRAFCKDFADFIISCGKGWAIDTTRNSSTSDFTNVPIWNQYKTVQSYYAPGLFFTNSNGCKLFLSIIPTTSSYGIALNEDLFALDVDTTSYTHLMSGVVMAIIPAGSSSSFGAYFDDYFLPNDATLLRGSVNVQEGAWWLATGCAAQSGCVYSFGLFVDSYCVGISGSVGTSGTAQTLVPGYFIGRIIGTLAHEENTNQAQYGSVSFSYAAYENRVDQEFILKPWVDETESQYSHLDRLGKKFADTISNTYTTDFKNNYGSVVKADGSRLTASAGSIRFYAGVNEILSTQVFSDAITGASRWMPYAVAVCTSDLATNGIIPGDGFKGYLDTDLFRCGTVNLNQTYANDAFIGWTKMLMVGWDSSNTDNL